MRQQSFLILIGAVLLSLAPRVHAAESTANCVGYVDTLPRTLSTPGTWCLRKNLGTTTIPGKAIIIAADNITLDCNDFEIDGKALSTSTSTGVYASNRFNATVRHCTITGFRTGIYLQSPTSGGGHVVEHNRLDRNTWIGVRVEGEGSVVRDNLVTFTGGTTSTANAYGVYGSGSLDIVDNMVADVFPASSGNSYGIYTNGNLHGSIVRNHVAAVTLLGSSGTTYGIYGAASGYLAVRDNDLTGDVTKPSTSIWCRNNHGRAMGNIMNGWKTGITGCGDASGNVLTP